MKKTLFLSCLLMIVIQTIQAQSIFINSGRNLTNYEFEDPTNAIVNLQNEIGQNYEVGFMSGKKEKKRYFYSVSAGVNEYNASGGSYSNNRLVWNTSYITLKGQGYYSLYTHDRHLFAAKAGLSLETLVHGRQQVNANSYDLLKQGNFNGLFVSPQFGVFYNFEISNNMNLHVNYDYAQHYSTKSNETKLSIINHSLSVGFSVNIN